VNLSSNDFELFGLPEQFAQDRAAIDARWKDLQREAHPDKFAAQGHAAQRVAMQWAVRVNEAYQRLKDPIKRASYLCALNGHPIEAEKNTAMPADFLMRQMEWREELDEARDAAAIDKLRAEVEAGRARALSSLDWLIDEKGDYAGAARQVRALMFIERFAEDVDAKSEAWGQ